MLNAIGIINYVFATNANGLPLHSYMKHHRFKLMFLDIGLFQTMSNIDAEDFYKKDIIQINKGSIAEQFVNQELIVLSPSYKNKPLLFWEKEKGEAEVDFVINIDSNIIPVEVKAGKTGTLRSLYSFLKFQKASIGIRISENELSFYNKVLSIPFYLVYKIPELVREAIKLLN